VLWFMHMFCYTQHLRYISYNRLFLRFWTKKKSFIFCYFFHRFENISVEKKIACVTGSNKWFAKQSTTPVNDAVNNRKNKLSNVLSASSLKQQSAGRHVAPLGHIMIILSQLIFALAFPHRIKLEPVSALTITLLVRLLLDRC
jgi:hypothetical protein